MTAPISSDDDQPSVLLSWLNALSHPSVLIHALEEVFNSCISTRPWRRLAIFSPALVLLAGILGLIIWGRALSRETLVERYATLAEEELAKLNVNVEQDERSTVLMQEEKTSAFTDMLYRRLLQLNDESARTRFLVAVQMAKSQRISQARQLMEEIAPLDGKTKGYPHAHAWLAIDLLSRQPLDKADQTKLLSHLEAVQDWDGAGSGLLALYANALAQQGKPVDALELMQKAAKKDPSLQSAYAIMARKFNVPAVADEASVKARERLKKAIAKPDAKLQDFIQLASLELTEENFQDALKATREGLSRVDKNSKELKYLGSEALRLMYRKSVRKTAKGIEFNLGYLDMAMKEFPENQNLATEIALLEDMGVQATAELKALLEQQLANGQATALAHLILANQEIKAGRMANAIPHLELTINAAPNNAVALNNLALALAITDSANAKRAEELIDRAITIEGSNPELYDSQGQIRLIAGRPLDAVESLEKAIGFNPNRVGTRELIIKAYRDAGLEDLAVQQEKTLTKLKAELTKAQAEQAQKSAKQATKSPPNETPPVEAPIKDSPKENVVPAAEAKAPSEVKAPGDEAKASSEVKAPSDPKATSDPKAGSTPAAPGAVPPSQNK